MSMQIKILPNMEKLLSKMEKREKIVNNNIIIALDSLTKALNEKFPYYHHAHVQVFMTFNTLYRLLLKEGVMSNDNEV